MADPGRRPPTSSVAASLPGLLAPLPVPFGYVLASRRQYLVASVVSRRIFRDGPLGRRRHLAGDERLAPAPRTGAHRRRLAIGAQRPVHLERVVAIVAGLAQAGMAARADQVVLLDLRAAVLAGEV